MASAKDIQPKSKSNNPHFKHDQLFYSAIMDSFTIVSYCESLGLYRVEDSFGKYSRTRCLLGWNTLYKMIVRDPSMVMIGII